MILSRRRLLQAGILTGAGAAIGVPELLASRGAEAALLDPTTIPQYVTPLFRLPAMPPSSILPLRYSVAARPITQQILPSGLPATPVFAFGSTTSSATFRAPGYTIKVAADVPAEVTWSNQLVDSGGSYVSPLLPVDPTIHWANPGGGPGGTDTAPTFTSTPSAYTGPVPLVVHLHGSHDYEESDGYPEAWWLPNAANIPSGYATVGSFYQRFKAEYADTHGFNWAPGSARFRYDNDQRATALWYHDHSLGLTRTSVRSGLVGQYQIQGGSSDLPAGLPGQQVQFGGPSGQKYFEYDLIFQDPSFSTDGTQYLPPANTFGGGGPYIPTTDIPPIWNAVFFGGTITVNGNTWPYMQVEARRYRFRLLNAAGVRTMVLKVVSDDLATRPVTPALPLWVIGSDGGFLPAPVQLQTAGLQIQPSERYDIIVDFTGITPGTSLYLINEGPASTVGTTGSMMQFQVVAPTSIDFSIPPASLTLPGFKTNNAAVATTRQVSFNEQASTFNSQVTVHYLCGTVNADGSANPLFWSDPITENPVAGTTEVWEVYNYTPVTHVFHVHLVEFQVLNRQALAITNGAAAPSGETIAPAVYEAGDKDSVTAPGGQVTRIKATFDHQGLYTWHCHFLDHEDNEMMRPWRSVTS